MANNHEECRAVAAANDGFSKEISGKSIDADVLSSHIAPVHRPNSGGPQPQDHGTALRGLSELVAAQLVGCSRGHGGV